VLELVESHLRKHCPDGVNLEVLPGHTGESYVSDPHAKYGLAAQKALGDAFPGKRIALIREGGSIPIINTFKRVLGVETMLLGLALPDCRAHAPNENFPIANFEAGIALNRALLERLALGADEATVFSG
jgi:acetylornithine deacetylase/succinyl-diaminopimelate desuccinylase-like protein